MPLAEGLLGVGLRLLQKSSMLNLFGPMVVSQALHFDAFRFKYISVSTASLGTSICRDMLTKGSCPEKTKKGNFQIFKPSKLTIHTDLYMIPDLFGKLPNCRPSESQRSSGPMVDRTKVEAWGEKLLPKGVLSLVT